MLLLIKYTLLYGIVLPAEAGGLTLRKQYKYGRVLLWKYTKPMQPAGDEQKGEAL